MGRFRWNVTGAAVVAVLGGVLLAGCADDGAEVRQLEDGDTGTGTGTATGTGTGTGTGTAGGPGQGMGGYEPVSDVAAHAKVVLDVCDVNELLDSEPYDYEAIAALYEDGEHSVNADDSVRTLQDFATSERDEPIWNDYVSYFDDPVWLDTFVSAAIVGEGPFSGEADAVRRQGIQKGIQNQIMTAWAVHELVAAIDKAAAGDLDPASGAPHNWDEAWAFYHGEEPGCAPYATANSRGENFGTGTAVNDAILTEMQGGLDALLDGDVDAARAARDEVLRQITITYVQASIRYGILMEGDLEEGDEEAAGTHQAEGWAFYRVIAPFVAAADPAADRTITGFFDLSGDPRPGSADQVQTALESVYTDIGISPDEVGTLQ